MARFLVTGGAGFIGSNIVETLLKKGIPKGLSPQDMKGLSPKGTDPTVMETKGTVPDRLKGLALGGHNIEVMNGVSKDRQEYISETGENL